MKRKLLLAVIYLITASYFFIITVVVVRSSYINETNLIYQTNIASGIDGLFLYFTNNGFQIPPLPFFVNLVFRSSHLSVVVFSTTMALFLLNLVRRAKNSDKVRFFFILIFGLLFFFYLPLLFVFTQNLQLVLLILIITLSNFFLIRFFRERKIYDIYYFGLLYGSSYWVYFETIFLLPLYALIIFVCSPKKNVDYKMSLVLVAFLPLLFSFLSWAYLSWLYTGNAVYNLTSSPLILGPNPVVSLDSLPVKLGQLFIRSLSFALPYYILLPYLISKKNFFRSPQLYIFFVPLLFILTRIIATGVLPAYHEYSFLLITVPLLLHFQEKPKFALTFILPFTLLATLIIGNSAFFSSSNPDEYHFSRILTRRIRVVETSFMQRFEDNTYETTNPLFRYAHISTD